MNVSKAYYKRTKNFLRMNDAFLIPYQKSKQILTQKNPEENEKRMNEFMQECMNECIDL